MIEIVAAVAAGYLLGSIPVGLIVTRLAGGVDVREYGSGKTGFTNTLRVIGLRRSLPVFLGDFGKGLAAALLPLAYTEEPWARTAGGLACIVGHVWPVFAGFRGGRGLLAGAGMLAALNPIAVLALVPLAGAVLAATRFMSLTSISAAFAAAVLFLALAALDVHAWAYGAAAAAGGGLIIALHRENMGRLLAGTEPRVGRGGERRASPPGG